MTKYKLWFLIMPASFLLGICLGSLSAARIDTAAFFSTAADSLSSASLMADSVLKALRQNALHAVLFLIFGTTFIGAVPSAVLLGVRGYGLGQTVGALVAAFGFRGFLASALGIFPHNLLYVPFFCLLAVFGAGFSGQLLKKERNMRQNLASFFLISLFLAIPILCGCLIEGYVSAPLMRRILSSML